MKRLLFLVPLLTICLSSCHRSDGNAQLPANVTLSKEVLLDKIKGGWMDFEAVVATPEMMKFIGPLGKVLGPRGLMPSAKAGTVPANVGSTVKEIKAGRVEYRVDKFGILHNAIGKASFGKDKILGNIKAYYAAVLKSRPVAVKGAYVKSLTLSTSMGLGVRIDTADAEKICLAAAE